MNMMSMGQDNLSSIYQYIRALLSLQISHRLGCHFCLLEDITTRSSVLLSLLDLVIYIGLFEVIFLANLASDRVSKITTHFLQVGIVSSRKSSFRSYNACKRG